MLKDFTIIGAAMFGTAIIGAVTKHTIVKQRNDVLNQELARVHEQASLEINKNGQVTSETSEILARLQRSLDRR